MGGSINARPTNPAGPAFHGLTIGFVDIDLIGSQAFLDEVALHILAGDPGWSREGVDMGLLFEVIHEHDRMKVAACIDKASPASPTFATEYRTQPKDGVSRLIVSYGRLQFNAEGGRERLLAIVMEVATPRPAAQVGAPGAKLIGEADLVALADHVIAARQLIDKTGFADLRAGVDSLLLRIGAELARGNGRARDAPMH